jgi:large subunit ribosomal protein L5
MIMATRLLDKYRQEVVPAMQGRRGYKNILAVPRVKKVVINMGVGVGAQDIKILEAHMAELALITGQRPVITRAKKAIANFKIREEQPIGCKVTLRGKRMYEFLDRLLNAALPRIRDFRGVSPTAFDGSGNYALGLSEQNIFPEIELDKIQRPQGMDIIIVTSAKTKEESKELLTLLGMPFRTN